MMENLPIPKSQTNQPVGDEIRLAENRRLAMDYRRQGLSFVAIGKKLGVSDKSAASYIRWNLQVLCKLSKVETEAYRNLELSRLDALLTGVFKNALRGDTFSVKECVSIIALRCKILGLEKPVSLVIAGDREAPLQMQHQHDIDKNLLEKMHRLAGIDPPPADEKIIDVTPPEIPGD
jgi:hypothetical protein